MVWSSLERWRLRRRLSLDLDLSLLWRAGESEEETEDSSHSDLFLREGELGYLAGCLTASAGAL